MDVELWKPRNSSWFSKFTNVILDVLDDEEGLEGKVFCIQFSTLSFVVDSASILHFVSDFVVVWFDFALPVGILIDHFFLRLLDVFFCKFLQFLVGIFEGFHEGKCQVHISKQNFVYFLL